jgi:NAD(P)-dependent dehydrogenase (short-subunit alcohol dehydrogenase family)
MKSISRRQTLNAWLLVIVGSIAWGTIEGASRAAGSDSRGTENRSPPVALITGSDRGIGFALVQELEARGWRVLATCRDPEHAEALKAFAAAHSRVTVDALDVSDNAAIETLSKRYSGQPIDALISNAGIGGGLGSPGLGSLSPDEFAQVLRINTYAPLKISEAFLEQVAASKQKKMVAITSGLGSLFRASQSIAVVDVGAACAGGNRPGDRIQHEIARCMSKFVLNFWDIPAASIMAPRSRGKRAPR